MTFATEGLVCAAHIPWTHKLPDDGLPNLYSWDLELIFCGPGCEWSYAHERRWQKDEALALSIVKPNSLIVTIP